MYKVLLVDDENWVVESLRTVIEWEKYGFKVIGQAYGGMEAYEFICNLRPHVVFTDIRMPGMNGLELIKKVMDKKIDVTFIIASGYAEFAYAQKALSYGAIDYCLKPFEETEIIKSLNKAKQIIDGKKMSMEYRIMDIIESDNNETNTEIGYYLREFGFDTEKKEILPIVSIGKDILQFPDSLNYLRFKAGSQKKVYLVEFNSPENMKENLEKQIYGSLKGTGISRKVRKICDIKNAIDESNIAAHQFFITGAYGVSLFNDFERSNLKISSILRQLNEAIRNKNMTTVDIFLNELGGLFSSGLYNMKHAFFAYNMVMSFIYSCFSEFDECFIDDYESLVELFKNVEDMLYYLKDQITRQMANKTGFGPDEQESHVIKEVINYVNKNFNKDIYIQNLSELFFINPNYLSRLFKKEVGLNFTEYLSKTRIEYACSLLRQTKLSIQQVSERTGYNDYFYFARIFKKVTGRTPGTYRSEVI